MLLCREHFQEDVQRKAREYLRQTRLFGRSERIIIELDGGRNSSALAYILKNTFQWREDIDLLAVVIDEVGGGCPEFTAAANLAARLDIPLHRESLPPPRDQDASGISLSARKREALSYAAQRSDAGIIATGEDLDEEALEIFLRYLHGDCGRYVAGAEGIHWLRPLRRIPKREVRLYALSRSLGSDLPRRPCLDRQQEVARRLLFEFDCRHPGTNYSLLRGWERLMWPAVQGGGKAFK